MIIIAMSGKKRERVKMAADRDQTPTTAAISRWKAVCDVKWYDLSALKFKSFSGDGGV